MASRNATSSLILWSVSSLSELPMKNTRPLDAAISRAVPVNNTTSMADEAWTSSLPNTTSWNDNITGLLTENVTFMDIELRGPAQQMNDDLAAAVLPVTIMLGLMAVIGVCGNLCVLYVYKFKYPRCNFRYFVLCLALVDLLSCLVTLPAEIFSQRHWFMWPENAVWYCKTKTYFNGFTVFLDASLLLLIAIDRYRKVCRPHGWQISLRQATQLCIAIFIIAIIFSAPAPFLWGKQTNNVTYKGQNVTINICEKSDEFKHTKWPSLFVYIIFIFPTVSFVLATAILYGLIMQEVVCGSLARKNLGNFSRNHHDLQRTNTDAQSQRRNKIKIANIEVIAIENQYSDEEPLPEEEMEEGTAESHQDVGTTESHQDVETEQPAEEDKQSETNGTNVIKKRPSANSRSGNVYNRETFNLSNLRRSTIHSIKSRVRTKTLIMFVVTVIFIVTTLIYFLILANVAQKDHIFMLVSTDTAAVFVFFWRLYFINHIINPIIYGFLDTRFKQAF